MIIINKIPLMKNILKVLLSSGLSFLLLSSAIHIDSHNLNFTDGYSICEINCDDNGIIFLITNVKNVLLNKLKPIGKNVLR